jgi:hypothetical protein
MMRYRISLLAAVAAVTLGLVFSACSDAPAPPDGAGGTGGDAPCSASEPGCLPPTGGTGGGSGGASPTGGAPSGGDSGIGGFGGFGAFGGFGGIGGANSCACDTAWSLECYCAEFDCPTFEEATEEPTTCSIFSPWGEPEMATGCGEIRVKRPLAASVRTYVYDEASLELIGAAYIDDTGFGPCDRIAYATAIGDATACNDWDIEPLCP